MSSGAKGIQQERIDGVPEIEGDPGPRDHVDIFCANE
jgi:hypothetical protein